MHDLKEVLYSQCFKRRSGGSLFRFVRNRKLPFPILFCLILNNRKGSVQDECDRFFKDLLCLDVASRQVTASAFCQARQQLKPEAFVEMNRALLHSAQVHGGLQSWKGFRLLAIDGSTLRLPSTHLIREEFGTVFSNGSENQRSLARISQAYDPLNELTIDLQIDTYLTHEHPLALRHFEVLKSLENHIVILDRGYCSFHLWRTIIEKGGHICVRLKSNSSLVKKLNRSGRTELIVNYKPPTNQAKKKCREAGLDPSSFPVRVIALPKPGKSPIYLMTTILDDQLASVGEIAQIYRMRWGVEEDFKIKKCRLDIENFTGKSPLVVKQDIFAKLLYQNLATVLSQPVKEALSRSVPKKTSRKYRGPRHLHKFNRKEVLSKMKGIVPLLFFRPSPAPLIAALHGIWQRCTLPDRPCRSAPRRSAGRTGARFHGFHMCYKGAA